MVTVAAQEVMVIISVVMTVFSAKTALARKATVAREKRILSDVKDVKGG